MKITLDKHIYIVYIITNEIETDKNLNEGRTMKATEMTIDDLKKAARNYNNANNEGYSDGNNPYRAELQRRAANKEAAKPETREARIDRLIHQLDRMDTTVARESGTYDADKIAALKAEIAALEDDTEKEFIADWTLEATKIRREKWNSDARKPGATEIKLTIAHGFTLGDLKKAVKHYGL